MQACHMILSGPFVGRSHSLSMYFVHPAEGESLGTGRVCPCQPAALQKADPSRPVGRLTDLKMWRAVLPCPAPAGRERGRASGGLSLTGHRGRAVWRAPHAHTRARSTLHANEAKRCPCASGQNGSKKKKKKSLKSHEEPRRWPTCMDRKYTQRHTDEKREDINQKFYGTDLERSFAKSNDWSNKYTFLVQKK